MALQMRRTRSQKRRSMLQHISSATIVKDLDIMQVSAHLLREAKEEKILVEEVTIPKGMVEVVLKGTKTKELVEEVNPEEAKANFKDIAINVKSGDTEPQSAGVT